MLWQKIGLALCAVLFLVGCEVRLPMPKFANGERVRVVISDDFGMVIDHFCYGSADEPDCRYWVRIPVRQDRTDTRLLEKDGPITAEPLALVCLHEFELEKVVQTSAHPTRTQ